MFNHLSDVQLDPLKNFLAFVFSWRPPRYFQNMPESKFERIRKKWHILVEGEDIPPPVKHFKVKHILEMVNVVMSSACNCVFLCKSSGIRKAKGTNVGYIGVHCYSMG